jgi:hypothetical protein
MAARRLDIVGTALPILGQTEGDREVSDFRAVPRSDEGNEDYQDRGMLGSFTQSEPFRNPSEVRFETGYGADREDLERGFCVPDVGREPAYDKANYEMRSTLPRVSSESFGNTDTMPDDWQFRSRNQRSRGFLTRPRIPTER